MAGVIGAPVQARERELWDMFEPKLDSVVLVVPNKWTKFKHDRLAKLVNLRIDLGDTDAYVKGVRYTEDPAYLDHAGAFVVATLQFVDTGKKEYTIDPRYLRDPETKERLVDIAGEKP